MQLGLKCKSGLFYTRDFHVLVDVVVNEYAFVRRFWLCSWYGWLGLLSCLVSMLRLFRYINWFDWDYLLLFQWSQCTIQLDLVIHFLLSYFSIITNTLCSRIIFREEELFRGKFLYFQNLWVTFIKEVICLFEGSNMIVFLFQTVSIRQIGEVSYILSRVYICLFIWF